MSRSRFLRLSLERVLAAGILSAGPAVLACTAEAPAPADTARVALATDTAVQPLPQLADTALGSAPVDQSKLPAGSRAPATTLPVEAAPPPETPVPRAAGASGASAAPEPTPSTTVVDSASGMVAPPPEEDSTPEPQLTPSTSVVTPAPAVTPTPAVPGRAPVPFDVGERFEFDVTFGPVKVGNSVMTVARIDTVRGRPTYRTEFTVRGGTLVYKVDDRYESWVDVATLSSLRHRQKIDEGSYERDRRYEIFPERQVYVEQGKPEQKSVEHPLDDGSFIYFVRTLPLEIGKTYTLDNYFRPDRNPVTVQVVRRERITVPAGTFNAIVVRPRIKTTGLFSEKGSAELWFADDSTRMLLQLKSKLSIGSLNLYLQEVQAVAKTKCRRHLTDALCDE